MYICQITLEMKGISLIAFFCGVFISSFAQDSGVERTVSDKSSATADNDDVQLLYRNEQEFGALLHSAGWGINYRRAWHVTGYKKRVLAFEIVGMRHPKEIKLRIPEPGTRGFFYGKQYVVTVLRAGWGYNKVITGKSERKGVELRLLTEVGASLALAKPVYLEVWHLASSNPPYGDIKTERYDPENPFQTPDHIVGRANYFRGVENMNFFPGGFAKLALSFEHASMDDDIKLVEVGVTTDVFYKTIPIMANTKNNQVYVNLYLNFMFGKKWF